MIRSVLRLATAGVLSLALAAGAAMSQGFRPGGGCWNWVTPQSPEQQTLATQMTDLHSRIRAANGELRALWLQNAPVARIEAKQSEVAALRAEVQTLVQANQPTLQQMGVPAACGFCNGYGASGQGYGRRGAGMGRGMGRGMAGGPRDGSGVGRGWRVGPRDGSGPNPYCPLPQAP